MRIKNVVSLFDGMSCGQIALGRAGITYENYYASEIDKYAIAVTQKNYPHTIQLGGVTKINAEGLHDVDLLMGGSPCQGFSIAGPQLNFDHPQSKLFFEYVRFLSALKPKYFLLENVPMKQEYQDVISEYMGVEPIMINSSLLSAQNRKRLYWTNIPNISQPDDKGLVLRDIIDPRVTGYPERRCTIKGLASIVDGHRSTQKCVQVATADDVNGHDILKRIYSQFGKSPTLNKMDGGNREPKILTDTDTDTDTATWRRLTPLECERLQTVPDNYTLVPWGKREMSNSQRYKMLGNGWTVDVIAHILKNIEQGLDI